MDTLGCLKSQCSLRAARTDCLKRLNSGAGRLIIKECETNQYKTMKCVVVFLVTEGYSDHVHDLFTFAKLAYLHVNMGFCFYFKPFCLVLYPFNVLECCSLSRTATRKFFGTRKRSSTRKE